MFHSVIGSVVILIFPIITTILCGFDRRCYAAGSMGRSLPSPVPATFIDGCNMRR